MAAPSPRGRMLQPGYTLVSNRYVEMEVMGSGSYGEVWKCEDLEAEEGDECFVAVKRMSGEDVWMKPLFTKRVLREILILSELDHPCVIPLWDVLVAVENERGIPWDLFCVGRLMGTDLDLIIRSEQPLTMDHVGVFAFNILRGLRYVHSAGVIHRDIKPANILVNENCDVMICDFGLARPMMDEQIEVDEEMRDCMTCYVGTRYYRAPELLMLEASYGAGVDVWAVGCIIAEMLLRKPLFAGKNYVHQLQLIVTFLGRPSAEDLQFVKRPMVLKFLSDLERIVPEHGKDFQTVFPDTTDDARDMMKRMLVLNSRARISVASALEHPLLEVGRSRMRMSMAADAAAGEPPEDVCEERPEPLNLPDVSALSFDAARSCVPHTSAVFTHMAVLAVGLIQWVVNFRPEHRGLFKCAPPS